MLPDLGKAFPTPPCGIPSPETTKGLPRGEAVRDRHRRPSCSSPGVKTLSSHLLVGEPLPLCAQTQGRLREQGPPPPPPPPWSSPPAAPAQLGQVRGASLRVLTPNGGARPASQGPTPMGGMSSLAQLPIPRPPVGSPPLPLTPALLLSPNP